MKKALFLYLFLLGWTGVQAATTLSSVTSSNSAWGANIGWINGVANQTNGAVIGEFFCSGYLYSANTGWISLGNGSPLNLHAYSNFSSNDCGVNHDGQGNLRGYAYGANIGWINFEDTGNPRVNLLTGVLSGYAYGANVGWISLSNAFAVVKTDSFFYGNDSDSDSIPDAWELSHARSLSALGGSGHDADNDGFSDAQEYLADTDPADPNDFLHITNYAMNFVGTVDLHYLTWTSKPSRLYRFGFVNNLNPGFSFSTISVLLVPDAGPTTSSTVSFGGSASQRYLRMEAVRPLSP